MRVSPLAAVGVWSSGGGRGVVGASARMMGSDTANVCGEVAAWAFERGPVEPEAESNGGAVVVGLNAGQRIVVRGGVLLND